MSDSNLDLFPSSIPTPAAEPLRRARPSPRKRNETMSDAAEAARKGIKRATEHAEHDAPGWLERALTFVRIYAEQHPSFLAEDVVAAAALSLIGPPPDGRAWGGVMRSASKRGLVVADGYGLAKSSNRSPKVRWKSLVYVPGAPTD